MQAYCLTRQKPNTGLIRPVRRRCAGLQRLFCPTLLPLIPIAGFSNAPTFSVAGAGLVADDEVNYRNAFAGNQSAKLWVFCDSAEEVQLVWRRKRQIVQLKKSIVKISGAMKGRRRPFCDGTTCLQTGRVAALPRTSRPDHAQSSLCTTQDGTSKPTPR